MAASEWKPDGPYCMRWGDYFVNKSGPEGAVIYMAYCCKELLHRSGSFEECKRAVEAHRRQK